MSDKEKVHLPSGYKCDGSEIQRNSVCCEGNKYVKCPTENCENSDRFESKIPYSGNVHFDHENKKIPGIK